MNVARGPVAVLLDEGSEIGNRNHIVRAPQGLVSVGLAVLRLARHSKLTSRHYVDCTCSIRLGQYSIVAGADTQIWTHGYVHETSGPGRYRLDGGVSIGANVYVGSRCIILAGVRVADGAMIGAGVTVARNLSEPLLYVSGPLRELPRPIDPVQRADLQLRQTPELCEIVYLKQIDP
jgi:acetyltransferase-like isoleucine patch superfamily enzyme